MNAVTSTILVTLVCTVVFASRRWALLAIVLGVFFLTQGQALDLAGLNVFPIRFLETAAFARVVWRRELTWIQLGKPDWILLLTYNFTALVWLLRSPDSAAEQFAFALDPTLCYLAFRGLMVTVDDLRWLLLALVVPLLLFTGLVALERASGHTSFAVVGANWELYLREGIARGSGAFRHASLLGSVAAAFLALYIGLWWKEQDRAFGMLGVGLCACLVLLSNSGGPVSSALTAAAGWMLWPLRERMRLVRYAMLTALVLLILFMKAPIWYLPYKISSIVGGGGYHRGVIMESAWNDLSRWWLFGMDIRDTAHWLPYVQPLTGGADITNQFVAFAIKGGLAAMALLILTLSLAFGSIGRQIGRRPSGEKERSNDPLLWGLGVAIAVHAVSWLGIVYFDQSWVVWLLHLSAVSAGSTRLLHEGVEQSLTATLPPTRRQRLRYPAYAFAKHELTARIRAGHRYRPRRLS